MHKFELSEKNFPSDIVDWFGDFRSAEDRRKLYIEKYLAEIARSGQVPAEMSFASILNKSGLPWLPLDISFPHEQMANEAKRLRDRFVSHRSGAKDGGYVDGNKGWCALSLHGISSTHTMSHGMYGYRTEGEVPYQWTDVSELCPVTTQFFKKVYPCNTYYRVRYTIIEPGGFIYPHVDRNQPALWEVNLALQNPEGFFFKMEHDGGYIPFHPGRGFILDVSLPHAVINMSGEDRIHMIVHGNPLREPGFQDLISRSYQKIVGCPELFWKANCK